MTETFCHRSKEAEETTKAEKKRKRSREKEQDVGEGEEGVEGRKERGVARVVNQRDRNQNRGKNTG